MIKELEFVLPTAFNGTYLDVRCTVQMIEPGEIADIIVEEYTPHEGEGPLEDTLGSDELHDEVEKIASAVYEQHADQLIECMNELF